MDEFLKSCEEARKTAFSFKEPLIVHHYDCDGISSGAIVVSAFLKEGKKFRRECIKKLDDDAIERYKKEKEIIFVDLGGGNERLNELQDVLIIDHHQTSNVKKHQINPMLYGIDGGDELSSSGTAYFVFRNNIDLGIVGAVGDMQWPLKGANRKMMEEGVKTEEVKVEEDLKFYGRYSRPLVQFLAYSDDPYVPGVSYREDKAMKLLADLGIPLKNEKDEERTYADLNGDEKKKLISAIANILVDRGFIGKAEELIGESYVFPLRPRNETYEANEFSTVLNACILENQLVYLNGYPTAIQEIDSSSAAISVNSSGKLESDPIVKLHKIRLPNSMKILEIKTSTGKRIVLTQNHELLTLSEGRLAWKAACKLSKDDLVATPEKISIKPRKLVMRKFLCDRDTREKDGYFIKTGCRTRIKMHEFDEHICELLGYLVGDGGVGKYYLKITFGHTEDDFAAFEKISKCFREKLGIEKHSITEKKNYSTVYWNGLILIEWFKKFVRFDRKKSHTAELCKELLELDERCISGLLRGLFSSDGNVYSGGVEFSTHSKKLSRQIQYLLLRLGIVSRLSMQKCRDCEGYKYRIFITGRDDAECFLRNVGFFGKLRNLKLQNKLKKLNPKNSNTRIMPVHPAVYALKNRFGIPYRWSSHFTYYKRGKKSTKENIKKYLAFFSDKIKNAERAYYNGDLTEFLKHMNISISDFSKKCNLSRIWMAKILSGKRRAGKIAEMKLNMGIAHCGRLLEDAKKNRDELGHFLSSDIYWDTITLIKEATQRPKFVYDLTTMKNHNYVAEGIIVHNCGRWGKSEIGIDVCLGKKEGYENARAMLKLHRKMLREGIEFATGNVQDFGKFYFLDGRGAISENIIGTVCGMVLRQSWRKPILGVSLGEKETIKVSGRSSRELVEKGLNLGAVLHEAVSEIGGVGGGHKIAAGASFPKDKINEFLLRFSESMK